MSSSRLLPCKPAISRGSPTFTDNSRAISRSTLMGTESASYPLTAAAGTPPDYGIWAVRNHRLVRVEMELSAIEIESGLCCQDSPMLSTMGLMIEPARHPPHRERRSGGKVPRQDGDPRPGFDAACAGRR